MILVDKDIKHAREHGLIKVEPWDEASLGTNSYDVHLAPVLRTYVDRIDLDLYHRSGGAVRIVEPLDCRVKHDTEDREIGPEGFVLEPGQLYLASTVEYTESHAHVPILNGKSSLGRLGLSIHVTAGTGDVGFCNHWTMELFVVKPLRVYAGMAIGQLLWFACTDVPEVPYGQKRSAKYTSVAALPQASEMARNFGK